MKRFKILYFIPLAGLLLAGCSLSDAKGYLRKAKSWAAENVVRPAKDKIDDYVDVDQFFQPDAQQQAQKEEEQQSTKHVHDYGELVAAVEPDCEHDGHLAYYHCEGCGKYFTEGKSETTLEVLTVEALGHVYGNLIAEVHADCEHAGVKAHYECSRCHQLFDEEKHKVEEAALVIPAVGHQYGELVPAVPADCEHGGREAYYHCDECDKYFTADKVETTFDALATEPLGHDYGNLIPQVDAQCEVAGQKAYYECSRCHQLFDSEKNKITAEQLIIAPLGHTYGELVAAQAATCEAAGHEAYYHCEHCDKYFTAGKEATTLDALTIPALGHDGIQHAAVSATCTEAGSSEYYSCSRCDKFFSDSACEHEIAADSWVIPAKGHTAVQHAAVSASCTAPGNSEYYECSDCHHYFSDSACQNEISADSWVIAKHAHTFDVDYPEVRTFATYRKPYHHCSECDKLYIAGSEVGTYVEIADPSEARDDTQRQYGDPAFGTEQNPYIIASAEDLILLKNRCNDDTVIDEVAQNDTFSGKFFSVTADIDLDGVTGFTPIGNVDSRPFSGTFDGNNHTISNYTYSSTGGLGLFSRVTNGTVKNLKISNFNITGNNFRVTPFCGRASNAIFENIHVLSATVSGTYQNSGLVGVVVTGGVTVIRNCSSAASVTATASASNGNGGLVGAVHSGGLTIENSTFSGTLESAGTGAGGIVGQVINGNTTINECTNNGTVHTAKEAAGGVLGYVAKLTSPANITITDCENKGAVTADTGNGAGGIFGANVDGSTAANNAALVLTIDGCINRGAVTGSAHVGGIGGLPRIMGAGSVIQNCINYGNITGNAASAYVGGIVSRARISVLNNKCYAEAILTNKTTVKAAKDCSADGKGAAATPGYILTVVDSAGTFSGAELIYD